MSVCVFKYCSIFRSNSSRFPSDESGEPGCKEYNQTHSNTIVACTLVLGTPHAYIASAAQMEADIRANRRGRMRSMRGGQGSISI